MTLQPNYLTENSSELWLVSSGFDDLLLTGVTVDRDGNQYQIMAQAEEATWGEPVPIDVAVQRWMTDGAVASTQGHENREMSFRVVVIAPTSTELAAGEAALARRAGSCLLHWTPSQGDGVAPTTVFEVWTWHLLQDFDTDRENRLSRAYQVRLTAKPWVRSKDTTTVAAVTISASPTTTSIDTCSATTGWTGSPNAATLVGGTQVQEAASYSTTGIRSIFLTRTGSVTGLGTTPYLMLKMTTGGASITTPSIAVQLDGIYLSKVSQIGSTWFYQIPAGTTSFTTLKIGAFFNVLASGATANLTIDDVSATDTVGLTTLKQLTRLLNVGGSVPTSGSIKIASPSATALGTTLLYSRPNNGGSDAYVPPLRQYRVSGNTITTDATNVSGVREQLTNGGASSGPITYTAPAIVFPQATYAVVARVNIGTADTLTLTFATGLNNFPTSQTLTATVTAGAAGPVWVVFLGAVTLPPQDLPPESDVNIGFTISGVANTGTHNLDDIYLLDITHGAVTIVQATTPAFTRLWIDSPDVDPTKNRPAVYIGTQDDRSDAATPFSTAIMSVGDHDLDSEGALLYTITDGVDRAAVSASFYRRWHTNAGS